MTTARMLKRSPLVENPLLQTYVFTTDNFTVTNVKTYEVRYEEVQVIKTAPDFYMIQTKDRKTYLVDFNGFENEDDKLTLQEFFITKFNIKAKK